MKSSFSLRLSIGCALATAAGGAFPQLQPPSGAAQAPALLPEVTVTATRIEQDGFDLPAAIDRVEAGTLREDKPQVNLSEALNRVPGIVVQNRQNYAQDLQISSRGFGARAGFGVRGVRLIADGIPATMPDGQGQAATFNLGSAERIEVLRGPFASLYGNASGGVIQIFTADAPPEPALGASAVAGSYATWKGGVQSGGQAGALNYVFDASRFATDGYRDHSAARRDHVNTRLKAAAGAGTLTLVVNALDQPDTQDPLGLTAAQAAANPRQAQPAALAFNTRKSVRQSQLGAVYDVPLPSGDLLQARAYAGDRQVTQFLAIPLAFQNTETASGGVVDLDRGYGGAGVRYTRLGEALGRPLTASVGLDYDRMAERRKGYLNEFGTAGALKRDEDDVVSSTDLYAQAEWRIAPRWSLHAGARHSSVEFESRDHFLAGANPDDSGAVRYARTSPVAGVAYRPVAAVNLYANIGKGFETPTFAELAYRPGGASGLNFALRPAVSTHREAGVKLRPAAGHRLTLAAFAIDVADEIVVESSSGGRTVFKNAARTEREGLEAAWSGRFPHGFEAALAYSLLDARFAESFASGAPAVAIPAGNRLPGVPPHTLYGEIVWRHPATGFHAGAEVRRNGRVYVNDANSESAAAYAVWGLRAGFEQRGRRWRLSEFVRVDNVTDRRYIGSVIVAEANGRFYEPAPERNWLAGVAASITY